MQITSESEAQLKLVSRNMLALLVQLGINYSIREDVLSSRKFVCLLVGSFVRWFVCSLMVTALRLL